MDRETFFRHLQRSRLLSEQELEEAARLTDSARARRVARALVDRGLLTRYQAVRLLAGKGSRLVLGQYRILEELGRGAMGRVFKALHAPMGRVVAIKVILPNLLQGSSTLELFTREVCASAQLHHPNIVTAYDANEIRGVHFLVMEYVDGPSLQELVKRQGPLPVALACELMRQAASALAYAQGLGVVHRDIKPANLLVSWPAGPPGPEGQPGGQAGGPNPGLAPVVKLADFGLARARLAGRQGVAGTIRAEPGMVLGTLDYIAPEQAHDVHAADIRSDLYSLGCTFYYTLTGQVPFPGGNALEKLLKHLMNEPLPVREVRPEVPAAVEAIVRRLLAKDREQRFQTPAELLQGLAALSGGGGGGGRTAAPEGAAPPEGPGGGPGTGGGQAALGELAAAAGTTVPQLPTPAGLTAPGWAAFREKFRQWTALVEFTLRRRGAVRGINRQAFAALHRELVRACQALASAAEGARREFYQRLEERLEPWLSPEALAQTDLEIHYQVAYEFQEAERDLDRWVAASGTSVAGQTAIGRLLGRFKRQWEQHHFKEQMRELYGVEL
jgi:hypothetical protein